MPLESRSLPPDLSTQRFSLVLSGALALGAYEAGVVAQLGYAFGRYTEEFPNAPPLATVDLISGASAGAVTGVMLASQLMRGGDPQDFVDRNWQLWCTPESNLENLLEPDEGERSYLSARKLQRLLRTHLHPRNPDPRRVRQSELIFTCTLTSLSGIPRQHDIGEDSWTYATHKDFGLFSVGCDDLMELDARGQRPHGKPCGWERLLSFAQASSAFPGVWQPVNLDRSSESYPPPWGGRDVNMPLSYVDGGVLNNCPLDLATEALCSLGGHHRLERRIYLVVEPAPVLPLHLAPPQGRPPEMSVARVVSQVVEASREQSFYQDVLKAAKTNHRLNSRDRLFPRLLRGYVRGLSDSELDGELARLHRELSELLTSEGSEIKADELALRYQREYLAHERESVQLEGLDEKRRRILCLLVGLLDQVADLGSKHRLYVKRISPLPDRPLVGQSLGHFGGLLHESLRQHDFAVGVENCYTYLAQLASRSGWPPPSRAEVKLPTLAPDAGVFDNRSLLLATRRAIDFLSQELKFNPIMRETLRLAAPWIVERLARNQKS